MAVTFRWYTYSMVSDQIITTNTKTVTEPELIVEVDPAEYDVFEFYAEQEGV